MTFIMGDVFPSGLRTRKTNEFVSPHHDNRMNKSQQQQEAAPVNMSILSMNEDDDSIRLSMDLPGVRAKDLEVSVQRGVLSIRGYRSVKGLDSRVVKKQKLSRRFAVDTDVVDVTRASANLANGVLIICAPKKHKPAVTVKIPVTDDSDFDVEEELLRRASLLLK
jgi:HSP20 family protein